MESTSAQLLNLPTEAGLLSGSASRLSGDDLNSQGSAHDRALSFARELANSLPEDSAEGSHIIDFNDFSRQQVEETGKPVESVVNGHLPTLQGTERLAHSAEKGSAPGIGSPALNPTLEGQVASLQSSVHQQILSQLVGSNDRIASGGRVPPSGNSLPLTAIQSNNGSLSSLVVDTNDVPGETAKLNSIHGMTMEDTPKFADPEFIEQDVFKIESAIKESLSDAEYFEQSLGRRPGFATPEHELAFNSQLLSNNTNTSTEAGTGSFSATAMLTSSQSTGQGSLPLQISALAIDPTIKQAQTLEAINQASSQDGQKLTNANADGVLRDQLTTTYGSSKWYSDFAGRIRLLAQANTPIAELNLNPVELGAIEIRIQTHEDGASVNFFSSNAATREVIDESLPRLRELLADTGISLQQGDVSDKPANKHSYDSEQQQWITTESSQKTIAEISFGARRSPTSIVDHYV